MDAHTAKKRVWALRSLARFLVLLSPFLAVSLEANPVTNGPATVSLVAEADTVEPGKTLRVGFHFQLEEHWHIYWRNPGASGLPVSVDWELPPGFEAGPIEWPAPEVIPLAGLVSYGYENEVLLAVDLQVPEELEAGRDLSLRANLDWLICKEMCLPGGAVLDLDLSAHQAGGNVPAANAGLFGAARGQLPADGASLGVTAQLREDGLFLLLPAEFAGETYFFAQEEGLVNPNEEQPVSVRPDGLPELRLSLEVGATDQLGDSIEGVLRLAQDSGDLNHWQVTVPILGPEVEIVAGSTENVSYQQITTSSGGFEGYLLDLGLAGWIVLAFIGGLILNAMPCVLPVLSLKVFSLVQHSGQSRGHSIAHGLAYTAGVVASFIVLAGVLLALRAAGEQIGWGFQLQNPAFVVVLAFVFFLFGLNLMGVFEIGTSLIGADSTLAARKDLFGSFGMGILATLVGAPCVGPFIGGVSGIAIQVPAATGLLLFAVMGLGLASPFLVLAIFPKLAAFLPKPGAWMESLKQFMGFLLMAALLFLLWVLGAQGGTDVVIAVLAALLLAGFGAWIYGRWAAPSRPQRTRGIARLIAGVLLVLALGYGINEAGKSPARLVAADDTAVTSGDWAAWSNETVARELAAGRPVFVDFTATWCLICQANKKGVLRTEKGNALFDEHDVATLSADWTLRDPLITAELEAYGRSGVPLYLLFHPEQPDLPQVLPQSLSIGVIRKALENRSRPVALSQLKTNR